MRWKFTTLLLAFTLFIFLPVSLFLGFGPEYALRPRNSASVLTQVKQLNELATVRFSIQRVVGMTVSKRPVGSESSRLRVQGEVIAGVDLADIHPADVRFSSKKTVAIRLPQPKILQFYLDESQTKVWDRHITWWTPWVPYDPDLEHKARLSAEEEVRQAALRMGILSQARSNAERAIRNLLSALGMQAGFPDSTT